ncbi:D-amino-acid transaminase [Rhabdaerophilum calidifontis]|uniref:D-amino-acid transaminase n=1 Tax=Rhabdaerophilum calidifontis TaxID=2604328 RepID=UPI0012398626|nr:D-amino-acid transaminase [Rhabdaerophilum calidifontis]
MPVEPDSRIVYCRGRFVPIAEAAVPIMDRGFLFADGIYEVTAVLGGRLVDNVPHLERLDRSLGAIGIRNPLSLASWTEIQRELIRRNALDEGAIYIEVTRGVHEREFTCPPDLEPTIVAFTQARALGANPLAETGVAVITLPDLRWKRRDIKSVALLPQVLAKFAAREAGVAEAWMVEDGFVTEGASSTAFIVTEADEIVTRPLSNAVLPGITRRSVMRLAEAHGLRIVERPFSPEEALAAREAFYTSASAFVMPIIRIDDQMIGGGQPGPLARALRRLYLDMAAREAV